MPQDAGMAQASKPWIYLESFKRAEKRYRQKTGHKQKQIAADLGIGVAYLHNILYGQKVPGIDVLYRAAALFGCSVTDFIDDPGANISHDSPLDQESNLWNRLIIHDISAEDLVAEDRKAIYEAVQFQLGQRRKGRR